MVISDCFSPLTSSTLLLIGVGKISYLIWPLSSDSWILSNRSARLWISGLKIGRRHVLCQQRQMPKLLVSESGSSSTPMVKLIGEASSAELFPQLLRGNNWWTGKPHPSTIQHAYLILKPYASVFKFLGNSAKKSWLKIISCLCVKIAGTSQRGGFFFIPPDLNCYL